MLSFEPKASLFFGARALGSVRLALSARLGMPAMKPVEIWPQDEARIGQENGLLGSDTRTAIHKSSMRCYVETLGPQ